jgi:UDP-glucose 4-epimerase
VVELDEACRRVAGVDTRPVHEPARAGELQRVALDPGRAARALGVVAATPLEEGLRTTWEWIRKERAAA